MEALGVFGLFIGFLSAILWIIIIIVFFVMSTNVGTITKLLGLILKELKDANDPLQAKVRKYDAGNS